jgi:hypothetical protein
VVVINLYRLIPLGIYFCVKVHRLQALCDWRQREEINGSFICFCQACGQWHIPRSHPVLAFRRLTRTCKRWHSLRELYVLFYYITFVVDLLLRRRESACRAAFVVNRVARRVVLHRVSFFFPCHHLFTNYLLATLYDLSCCWSQITRPHPTFLVLCL